MGKGTSGLIRLVSVAVATVLVFLGCAPAATACSRVTWLGPDGMVITGRSMDWPYSFNSHLYAVPAGSTQDGAGGVNSLTWTRKYGAIEVAGTTDPNGPIDGVFDGMNEKGLVANLLYLGESDFGPAPADDRPRLLEICPASFLKARRLYFRYKGASARARESRAAILTALEWMGLTGAATFPALLDDAQGDALDSLLAAFGALRAWRLRGREVLLNSTTTPGPLQDAEGTVQPAPVSPAGSRDRLCHQIAIAGLGRTWGTDKATGAEPRADASCAQGSRWGC